MAAQLRTSLAVDSISVYYAIKPSNYSFQKFFLNSPIIPEIIPTKKTFQLNPCNVANIHKNNYIQLQITTLIGRKMIEGKSRAPCTLPIYGCISF